MKQKFKIFSRMCLAVLLCSLFALSGTDALDWPQLQGNPQRHGYSSENFAVPFSNTWVVEFSPERLFPQTQPVIVNDKLYIGTEHGTMYCYNATNGTLLWKYPADGQPRLGAIIGTAGVTGGKVIFGSMDGFVYSLDANSGSLSWKYPPATPNNRFGFSSSVLIAESKIYIPDRGGIYYALNPDNGSELYKRDIGTQILGSSCYDNSRIFFGGSDMKMRAINSSDFSDVWQSKVCEGVSFKDFWPIAYNGYVMISISGQQESNSCSASLPDVNRALTQAEIDAQDTLIQCIQNNPADQRFFCFSQSNGSEMVIPHWGFCMSGAIPPVCISGDGRVVMTYPRYGSGRWGKMEINSSSANNGKFVECIGGGGNPDENYCVSAAGRLVFTMQCQEQNAGTTACFNIDSRQWTVISDNSTAYYARRYWWTCTEGGGTTPACFSNKRMFHTYQNNLSCRTFN